MDAETVNAVSQRWVKAQDERGAALLALTHAAREYADAQITATAAHARVQRITHGNGTAAEWERAREQRRVVDGVVQDRSVQLACAAIRYDATERELARVRETYVRTIGAEPTREPSGKAGAA